MNRDKSANDETRLGFLALIALNFPILPVAIGMFCLSIYIPKYYAIDLGIGLATVGVILGAGRFVDVLTDPIAGYLSDQTRTRFGARKPWVVLGLPLYCLSTYAFCNPPENVGVPYLIIVSTSYFLSLTAFGVPFGALGLEVSKLKNERSLLLSMRIFFQLIGSMIAALLPFALAVDLSGTLKILSIVLAIIFLPSFLFFTAGAPEGKTDQLTPRQPLKAALRACWDRPEFRRICVVWLCVQLANTLHVGLMLLFVTYVMGDEQVLGLFFISSAIGTALGLPFWYYLSKKIGKYKTWQIAILLMCAALVAATSIREGDLLLAIVCGVFIGSSLGCDGFIPASIVADIVHKDETEDRQKLAGLSSAVLGFITKFTVIAPMVLAFPVLGWMGVGKTDGFSESQYLSLIGFYLILPVILRLIGLCILRHSKPSTTKS